MDMCMCRAKHTLHEKDSCSASRAISTQTISTIAHAVSRSDLGAHAPVYPHEHKK